MKLGYIIGEAPAKPCRRSDFCMGRFMKAVCHYAQIQQLDYLKLGRENLYAKPETHKHGPLIDCSAATAIYGHIVHESISLGADFVFILAMGARVNHAIKVAAEISAEGYHKTDETDGGSWVDALKRGTVRITTTRTSVQMIKPWPITVRSLYLPHPSGLSRLWNDRAIRETAGQAIRTVVQEIHPIDVAREIRPLNPSPESQ